MAPAPAPREQGWKRIILALLAFVLLPFVPLLRVAIPIEQSLILIVPALAACALVGWWAGGRFFLALTWTALAVWLIVTPMPGAPRSSRSQGLVTAPRGVVRRRFDHEPASVVLPAGTVGGGAVVRRGLRARAVRVEAPDAVERTVRAEYARRVDSWLADWESVSKTREWIELTRDNPGWIRWLARARIAYGNCRR